MLKAIIVDDEPAVASVINYFIEKENLPIEIAGYATNGVEAIKLIRQIKPALVFLDISMPLKNGFEVMQEEPDYQYIIVTAYESFQYAQQALRLGAKDIILKPVEGKQLLQAIGTILDYDVTGNNMIDEVLNFIHTNYAQKIELNALAKQFYVTPSHLARVFKKHTGKSLITYLNYTRIKKASQLLLEKKVNIKEIAEQTGYGSLNNFYKYFKLYTGTTPSHFHQDIKIIENPEEDM